MIVASDVDTSALATARANAHATNTPSKRSILSPCDLFDAIRSAPLFDVVCSNPPYIPTDAIAQLEPEITRYEPIRALDGGPDGLDIIRELTRHAGALLKPGGALILEIGDSQERAVREVFSSLGGLRDIETVRDLAGKPRVIKGRI